MTKGEVINNTMIIIDKLPLKAIQEVKDFADFILNKLEEQTLNHGIQKLIAEGKPYKFLKQEEDLYSVEDLKIKYV